MSGITVVDFSQFLSGPYTGLRLADLGARVVKIENPRGGDLCRRLYISNVEIEGDSSLFHAINRNKMSFCVDLKDERERLPLVRLLEKADVVIQNFRPGVIERLGFGYEDVRRINPRIVYGSISGYGTEGPLAEAPGQDLLVQSLTGLARLGEEDGEAPMAYGLAVADMSAGALLAEGILAALVRRSIAGQGALVEVSLLESTLDLMQEALADAPVGALAAKPDGLPAEAPVAGAAGAFRAESGPLPAERPDLAPAEMFRAESGSESAKAPDVAQAEIYRPESGFESVKAPDVAPAGIYRTGDSYIAIGRGAPLFALGRAIGWFDAEERVLAPAGSRAAQPGIRERLQSKFGERTTAEWLASIEQAGIPCSEVLDWPNLLKHDGFRALEMIQTVRRASGATLAALRCPIRIDGKRLTSATGSPGIGEHNTAILRELEGR
nr:CoA transferase [Cohnella zeiphila]